MDLNTRFHMQAYRIFDEATTDCWFDVVDNTNENECYLTEYFANLMSQHHGVKIGIVTGSITRHIVNNAGMYIDSA